MRRFWQAGVAAGGVLLAAGLAAAQVPGAATPVAAAPGAAGAAVVGVEPKLGFFARCCAGIDACRRKLCLTPAGQMLNSMTKPLTAATGGIIPPFCPIVPTLKDMQQPGVAGTSDAIKKDALEAKMRRDKVRFLGTVDCRYYPDAIDALIAGLRTDGSECVRYEAALALGRGCCCNQKTIDALDAAVSGTDKDGNPAERSVRVRCAAAIALERCLSCYVPPSVDIEPVEPKLEPTSPLEPAPFPGEKQLGDGLTAAKKTTLKSDEKQALKKPNTGMPSKQSVEAAWKTLNEFNALLAASRPQAAVAPGADRHSLYEIVTNSTAIPAATPVVYNHPAATRTPDATAHTSSGRASLGQPVHERIIIATTPPAARPLTPAATPASAHIPMMPVAPSAPQAPTATPMTTTALTPIIAQVFHAATADDRIAAVRELAKHDWMKHPVVASALIIGAKNDAISAVRVECIRKMAASQMSHPQVISELTTLSHDSPDASVREEAAKALVQLKPATP